MQSRPSSAEKRILQSNRAARNLMHLCVAAGFCAAACVVAQAYVLSDVVNRIFIRQQAFTDVISLLGVLLALALIRAAIIWSADVLAQRSASHLKSDLREKLTQRLTLLGPAYTQSERSGELVNTVVEGVEALDDYITAYQPARLLAVIVPVFVLIVIFLLAYGGLRSEKLIAIQQKHITAVKIGLGLLFVVLALVILLANGR
jgi:ATP-binding cassette subfamily C protein CydD